MEGERTYASLGTEWAFISALLRTPRYVRYVDDAPRVIAHRDTFAWWSIIRQAATARGLDPGDQPIQWHELDQTPAADRTDFGAFLEFDSYMGLLHEPVLQGDVEFFHRRLRHYAALREVSEVLYKRVDLYDPNRDPAEQLDGVKSAVYAIKTGADLRSMAIGKVASAMLDAPELQRRAIGSGFTAIDAMTGLWVPGSSTAVCARTHHGKSLFIQRSAERQSDLGNSVGIITMEDPKEGFAARWVACDTRLPFWQIRDYLIHRKMHAVTAAERARIEDSVATSPIGHSIHLVEARGVSAENLGAVIRDLVEVNGCDIVWVDYIQKVHLASGSYDRPTAIEISIDLLENAAGKAGIPLGLAVQLNRGSERDNRPPELSDAKWAGAIEEMIANGIVLWQPGKSSMGDHARTSLYAGMGIEDGDNCILVSVQKAKFGSVGSTYLRIQTPHLDLVEKGGFTQEGNRE